MKITLLTLILSALITNSALASDQFVLIKGGTFKMGSSETENWRSNDETQHEVTVGDFYISCYEVTQAEYKSLMGNNPSNFQGDKLPVENVSWLDAVKYCNARSENENLTPVYAIEGNKVTWNTEADGYRLPTEAEWEYACRAGTKTPFNTENSISPEEANYYGHYPYEIEENYFSQSKLTTKPGIYREKTLKVGSFKPNKFGLYDMHGNVAEWCWDIYAPYNSASSIENPVGPLVGTRRVNRGGAWNDFAKNIRSAYRAVTTPEYKTFNLGFRLARGGIGSGAITAIAEQNKADKDKSGSKILIAYFSWSGNTRGIAEEIRKQTGADILELELEKPYSENYDTLLMEAQKAQHEQTRPKLKIKVKNFEQYDIIMLGYPNWWASIPMPIASFLEEYDFSGKKIMPFCSHGGGRFGQTLTAIAKLAPNAVLMEGLSVHYSGGSRLISDIASWLAESNI